MGGVGPVAWEVLKAFIDAEQIDYAYATLTDAYYIYTIGLLELSCIIPRDGGDDVTDWEDNYQAGALVLSHSSTNFFMNITGNTTAEVKTSPGVLHGISVNNCSTGGTATIYDNTSASGTKIMTLKLGSLINLTGIVSPLQLLGLNTRFSTGLIVVTSGSTSNDITVFYR